MTRVGSVNDDTLNGDGNDDVILGLRGADEIERSVPLDLAATHLRDALDHLGEIVGRVTTEDLLDRIFSEFCIGK